jgi:Lon protease-like protein
VAIRLPLFPLGTVLVPGLVLPLHIFEPKYRALTQSLLDLPDGTSRQFGVIAVQPGQRVEGNEGTPRLYGVGCTAELREVTPYDDGRFDIVSVGHLRFRLLDIDETADTPYLTGLVDYLGEDDGTDDEEELAQLADRVALRFAAYRDRLRVDQAGVPTDPRVLSYLIAAAAVLTLPDRQTLLQAETTSDRLRAELDLLRKEIGLIDAFRALPAADILREPLTPN